MPWTSSSTGRLPGSSGSPATRYTTSWPWRLTVRFSTVVMPRGYRRVAVWVARAAKGPTT